MTEQSVLDAINTAIDKGFVVPNTRKTYRANAHRFLLRVPHTAWDDFHTVRTYFLTLTDARKRVFGVVYRLIYTRLAESGEVRMVSPEDLMARTYYLPAIADPLITLSSVASFGLLHEARWRDVKVATGSASLCGILLHSDAETALTDLLTYFHPDGVPDEALHFPVVPLSRAAPTTPMATDIMEWLVNALMSPEDDLAEISANTLTALRKRGSSLHACEEAMRLIGTVFTVAKQRQRIRAKELAEEAAHLLEAGDIHGFHEIWGVLKAQFTNGGILTPTQRVRWHRAPSLADQEAAVRPTAPSAVVDPASRSIQQGLKESNRKFAAILKSHGAIDV